MPDATSSPIPPGAGLAYVVGIDIGMESCMMCCLTMEKRQVIKPNQFSNDAAGFEWLFEHLDRLKTEASQILIGLEATSRYGENLYHALLKRSYRLCLLHPGQIHAFAQQRGLRAKTDRLDAITIARALLSGEARFGYVPSDEVVTYRELTRLHQQLTEEVVRYKNEMHALLVVLFPEFTQVFADPSRASALTVLKAYPSAQAMSQADPEQLYQVLRQQCPGRYGRKTAGKLIQLAKASVSSGVAIGARSSSMRVLADQLEHTQKNLELLQQEIERLVGSDPKARSVLEIPELGPMTVAVLRAELGDLDRFAHMDQVVAYVGLDLQVKQSGKWKGQTKLSKRGSGHVRRILYLAALRSIRLPSSPFGIAYHRLVDRGMKKGMAVIAVMRKLLIVTTHLIQTQEDYDAGKVGVQALRT
ncbi:MAG TPA: IS110 family transposase [Ktedonosporobacter sp.]|nr:IS110 family transposase [Ktedonosporobacter sp.]